MSNLSISIVTPVYNRKDKVLRSIESSLALVKSGFAKEIIVVDDASSDGSYECIKEFFSEVIEFGLVKLYKLPVNMGVTGAKNFGAKKSTGDYLAFMDSDDVFLNDAGGLIYSVIKDNQDVSLFFFRCLDLVTDKEIGPRLKPSIIDLRYLLRHGTPGECLPVVSRKVFLKYKYDKELRGCESLAYYKILRAGHSAFISDKIVRGYCSEGLDRLSTKSNINKRAGLLLRYNIKVIRFLPYMSGVAIFKLQLKIAKYLFVWLLGYLPRISK
jgi:glycosyltransferase involved in cell wall biosynthesis